MIELIAELRSKTATVDNSSDSLNYWTDDDLQKVLDRYAMYVRFYELNPLATIMPGTTVYTDHQWSALLGEWVEMPTSGIDSRFTVQKSDGTYKYYGTAEENFTVDANRRLVILNSADKYHYYISAYFYDVNAAAAEIWQQKADRRVHLINVKTDNTTINASQEYDHCIERAKYYKGLIRFSRTGKFLRGDQHAYTSNA